MSGWTRRRFLATGAASFASLSPLRAARCLGAAERLNVAAIGVGGMGAADLASVAGASNVRIAALCDVDAGRLAAAAEKHAEARRFADWRRLLDAMASDLDAVIVSTPDHMHGPIALAAMERELHVYCQKPIAHNLRECRAMARSAERSGVVTQMGTQIHSHEAYRTAVATLRSGVIGRVEQALLWVSRSWAGPASGRPDRVDEVPEGLDWDLWLGVAPERPFVEGVYHPGRWRGWRDFGSGTLGDMGCHIFDPVCSALDLAAPLGAVSAGPAHREETFAGNGDVRYRYPATEFTTDGELPLRWVDGGVPEIPEAALRHLPEGEALPGAGSLLVGERGVMVIPHWSTPRLFAKREVVDGVVPREGRDHYHEWVDACRGEGRTSTPFSYSGPLTEAVLLGTIAGCFPERELGWDPEASTTGDAEADELVGRSYRDGWEPVGVR